MEGRIWRVRAPPAWPWLLLGLPFVVSTGLLMGGPRRHQASASAVFACLAAVATVVIAVGFAASTNASAARVLEGFDEVVFAAIGAVFLLRGGRSRRIAAAVALGFLALIAGGLKVAPLNHGVVLSALPATAARASVALALWSGAAAVAVGGRPLAKWLADRIAASGAEPSGIELIEVEPPATRADRKRGRRAGL
jgi:hypothetical protein